MQKEFISLLYIHDSKIRDDLSKFSKQNGFILNTCDDFLNASDQVELTAPDLILIESNADTLTGVEKGVNKLIKTASNFKPAVFLILSEFPEPENRLALLRMGIDEFLIKPFFTRELKEKYNGR